MIIVILIVLNEDEVESIVEGNAACLKGSDLGGGRPSMCAGEVVQERLCRTKEAAVLARAAAWCMWTRLAVDMLIVVSWPGTTAMGCIRARDTDGLHQALHGVAPVVVMRGNAANMAPALWRKLVTARRAHHMALVTLHRHMSPACEDGIIHESINNILFYAQR